VTEHVLDAPRAANGGGRGTLVAVAISLLGGALVSLLSLALVGVGDHDRSAGASATHTYAAPRHAFTVALPAGWRALPPSQLAALPTHPAAVLRRDDRKGLIVVRPTAPVRATGAQLVHGIGRRLRHRFPGFQAISARFTHVRGGRAFDYTFVRDPGHTVQSLVLVAAQGRAYEIDAIAPGDAPRAAREIGAIVSSFGP
jgi:hypothetical protein